MVQSNTLIFSLNTFPPHVIKRREHDEVAERPYKYKRIPEVLMYPYQRHQVRQAEQPERDTDIKRRLIFGLYVRPAAEREYRKTQNKIHQRKQIHPPYSHIILLVI